MDYLHAKLFSDLSRSRPLTDDEFYTRHSCAWLQCLKWLVRAMQQTTMRQGRNMKVDAKQVRS